MKKIFGKNKAGGITIHQGVFMILSIVAVTLFIGTAIQPAVADPIVDVDPEEYTVIEESNDCGCSEKTTANPKCDTCVKAVFHAVKYMKKHVKTELKDKGVYFLKTADASVLVVEGLILGMIDSGFTIQIDYKELKSEIDFWVGKLWGPQLYFVTRFMAKLGAVSIGITCYLLSFCIKTSS